PDVDAARHAAARVNRLHPAHGQLAVDLREAQLGGRVVQVQELNALAAVKGAYTRDAGAAQAAGTVVQNSKVGHGIAPAGASSLDCKSYAAGTRGPNEWGRTSRVRSRMLDLGVSGKGIKRVESRLRGEPMLEQSKHS